jgi:hypothetical protein
MKIKVEDKLFIESDDMQFVLKKYSGNFDKKTEKETYKVLGYFSTLKQAVKHLIKLQCMESTAETFEQLFDDLDRIENKIDSLIKI